MRAVGLPVAKRPRAAKPFSCGGPNACPACATPYPMLQAQVFQLFCLDSNQPAAPDPVYAWGSHTKHPWRQTACRSMALGCQPPHPLFKEKTMAKQWKPVLLALAMTAVAAPVLAADCAVEIEGNDAMQFNKPTITA